MCVTLGDRCIRVLLDKRHIVSYLFHSVHEIAAACTSKCNYGDCSVYVRWSAHAVRPTVSNFRL